MWLMSKDPTRKFTRKVDWRDNKGERHEVVYTVGSTPVEVPDEHADIVMNTFPAYIVAVPETAPEELSVKLPDDDTVPDGQYMCSLCQKTHMLTGSKIGDKHLKYKV